MQEVYLEIKKELKDIKNKNIIVAVSGGADSMTLLHLLVRVKEELDINIVCAHVNHNMRVESENEKDFVRNFCEKNGVIFEYMKIENYGDDNFHNEARIKRYNYFESLIKKYDSKYLFTAHHGDDLIETILMRIVRGASFKGYSGFSRKVARDTYTIYRPLITVTKSQIYDYINENGLSFVEDQSNFKDVYTRNRYRKYVLPMLKSEDINVHSKFYKFSKTILEYNEYVENQVKNLTKTVINEGILDISEYMKLDKFIQEKIIYMFLEDIYQDDLILITDKHVSIIYNLISSEKSNSYVYLPNNLKAIKSYNKFYIEHETNKTNSYEFEIISKVTLPNGKTIELVEYSDCDDNNICRLDSTMIKLPLIVRTKTIGDKIYVKGMLGSKKVKDIFIDCKIPKDKRETWPIVTDSDNRILWIPGLKKSKFNSKKDEKCDIILKYY